VSGVSQRRKADSSRGWCFALRAHVRRPGSVKVDGDGVVERAIGFDGKVRDVRKARSVELDDAIDKQAQSVEPFAVAHS
jgi:hypothetical protein